MTRKAKYGLVLIILLAGVSLLAARERSAQTRGSRRPEPATEAADPYENRTVMVEAFVVQVDLAALYGMEVNPLGEAPHSVSVTNLLEYLQAGDKANVLVGAKAVAMHQSGRSTSERTATAYYPKTRMTKTSQGLKETVDHVAYENGETLTVTPAILSENAVALSYSFSYSGSKGAKQQSDAPLDTVSWSWDGDVSLNVGRPRIVGATQDEKAAVFFVLTAHILE